MSSQHGDGTTGGNVRRWRGGRVQLSAFIVGQSTRAGKERAGGRWRFGFLEGPNADGMIGRGRQQTRGGGVRGQAIHTCLMAVESQSRSQLGGERVAFVFSVFPDSDRPVNTRRSNLRGRDESDGFERRDRIFIM